MPRAASSLGKSRVWHTALKGCQPDLNSSVSFCYIVVIAVVIFNADNFFFLKVHGIALHHTRKCLVSILISHKG